MNNKIKLSDIYYKIRSNLHFYKRVAFLIPRPIEFDHAMTITL